jgi:hypothetical protein
MEPEVRKIVTIVEEIYSEGSQILRRPLRLSAAIAVVKNPFAGRFEEDLGILSVDYSENLGPKLADLAAKSLGTKPEVFGKACIVGLGGEVQHGSSIIHTRVFGDALRGVADGVAPVSAAEKRGPAGASLDISLRYVNDTGLLDGMRASHLLSWEIRVPDAPEEDEIVIVAAVGDGGRPNPRL